MMMIIIINKKNNGVHNNNTTTSFILLLRLHIHSYIYINILYSSVQQKFNDTGGINRVYVNIITHLSFCNVNKKMHRFFFLVLL